MGRKQQNTIETNKPFCSVSFMQVAGCMILFSLIKQPFFSRFRMRSIKNIAGCATYTL